MVLNNCLGNRAWGWTRNFVTAVSKYFQVTRKKQGWESQQWAPVPGGVGEAATSRQCTVAQPSLPRLAVRPMRSGETGVRRDKLGPQNMKGGQEQVNDYQVALILCSSSS